MNALFEAIFRTPRRSGYVLLDRHSEVVREIGYQDVVQLARRRAAELRRLGPPGTIVGLVFDDPIQFATCLFACVYLGLVGVPIAPRHALHLAARVRAVGGVALVVEAAFADRLRGRGISVHGWWPGETVNAAAEAAPCGPVDTCLIQLSSGTTGEPKAIELTAPNILSNERAIARHFGHTADSRVFGWLPHTHDMGLFGTLLQPFFVDCVGYLAKPRDFVREPLSWIRSVSRHHISTSGAPTFAYGACASAEGELAGVDLCDWRIAFVGAEPVRAEVLRRFCQRFSWMGFDPRSLMPCYGLAEATLFVVGESAGRGVRTLDGSGRGFSDEIVCVGCAPDDGPARVRVRPLNGSGFPGVGEILVRGPSVAEAHLREFDDGRWLATGDIGFIDDGSLYVCARLKDVVKVRGRSVALSEIDRCVEAVLDDRAIEVCSFSNEAAASPHDVSVVLQGRASGCGCSASVAKRVERVVRARFSVSARVKVLAPRPRCVVRTPSGKLNRGATRARCAAVGDVLV